MKNVRRALLASLAVAVAVPALPATASADDQIVTCSATFLVGPVRCKVAQQEQQIREDHPVVDAILDAIPG